MVLLLITTLIVMPSTVCRMIYGKIEFDYLVIKLYFIRPLKLLFLFWLQEAGYAGSVQ